MAVRIEPLETAALRPALGALLKRCNSLQWAVAWATENEVVPELLKNLKKVKRIVIGTHFCQTSPTLLAKLASCPGIRVMPPAGGTFHPKLYLFVYPEGQWTAIVGSPNFTNGALTENAELALIVSGEGPEDPVFKGLQHAMERYWKSALPIDPEFLREYAIQYRTLAKARQALARPPVVRLPGKDASHSRLLDYSFDEFAALVERDKYFAERVALLAGARKLFAAKPEFSEMDGHERRAIAGLIDFVPSADKGIRDWKLFGAMSAMGDFANRVADNDLHLSRALDAIPPAGDVSDTDYERFVKEFIAAFKSSSRIGGVPTASRLLAMKRPDRFVCVDSKNNRALATDLGYSHSTLTLPVYWERVVLPLTQSPWWQAARPTGPRKAIWDGRVALLDALYYRAS